MFKFLINYLKYFGVRAAFFCLQFLPLKIQFSLVQGFLSLISFLTPRYKKVAERNLARAFPESSAEWRQKIMIESKGVLARVVVDLLRLHLVTAADVDTKFSCSIKPRLLELVKQNKPIVFATGHLGSFEMLAHYLALIGVPLAFIARRFSPPQLDGWWTKRREANGNVVIERSGALKGTLRFLNQGKAVGVLFDHNIRHHHAVFVDWFGYPAATSKLVGIAATRTNAAVVVISIRALDQDRYEVNAVECDFESLYQDQNLSSDEKILEITKRVSKEYEAMIRQNPGEWFWAHRRWKTAPEGVAEDFYSDL